MPQCYPLHKIREVERRWRNRAEFAPTRVLSRVREQTPGPACPACKTPAPTAPLASEYLGGGLMITGSASGAAASGACYPHHSPED